MSAKVAIMAGGGSPTGRATTAVLAAGGPSGVAGDRGDKGRQSLPDPAPAVAADSVDRIAAEVGPPDVLVNTIGAFGQGDVLSTTPEQLRFMLDVNLAPALWLSQAAARHMQQQGSGAIVHMTARPGIEP